MCAVFLFDMSLHYHINNIKYLFERHNKLGNLENEHCPGMRNVHLRFPSVAQKRRVPKVSNGIVRRKPGKAQIPYFFFHKMK